MYLTGGQFKGIKIETPDFVRPTLSKVRESIFNILNQYEFKNKTFLDMFAGSAIMSLEAISRGYIVLGVEINKKNISIIKKNYEKVHLEPNIILKDALKLNLKEKFEIIYIDPPWDKNYSPIIKKAQEMLEDNGIIIIEHDKEQNLKINNIIKENNLNLKIIKEKKYGRCLITCLNKS